MFGVRLGPDRVPLEVGLGTDYCPFCARVRVVKLRRYRQVAWIRGLRLFALGRAQQEGRCRACGHRTTAYRGRPRGADLDWAPDSDLAILAALPDRTRPAGSEASAPLDRDERIISICRPLVVANRGLEQRQGEMDGITAAGLAVAVLGPWLPIYLALDTEGAAAALWMGLAAAVFALGIVIATWGMMSHLRRWLEREYAEYFGEQLASLCPSYEEVSEAASVLRGNGLRIGRVLRPRWLLRRIAAAKAQPPAPEDRVRDLLFDDVAQPSSSAHFRRITASGRWRANGSDRGSQPRLTSSI